MAKRRVNFVSSPTSSKLVNKSFGKQFLTPRGQHVQEPGRPTFRLGEIVSTEQPTADNEMGRCEVRCVAFNNDYQDTGGTVLNDLVAYSSKNPDGEDRDMATFTAWNPYWSGFVAGSYVYCCKMTQGWVIVGTLEAPSIRFSLDYALSTAQSSQDGTIEEVYGCGRLTVGDTVSLWNPVTSTPGSYMFSAGAGACGIAVFRAVGVYTIVYLPPDSSNYKPMVRFTLDSALATTDATKAATITSQYGPGISNPSSSITVYNLLESGGSYKYYGDSGDAGLAHWDSGSNYIIVDMECP